MTSLVLIATLRLLKDKQLEDLKRLADDCDLTVEWLRLLKDGKIKEPGINKVERLYNALSGKSIEL